MPRISTRRKPETPPVEHQHRWRLRQPLTAAQWATYLLAVDHIESYARAGRLGQAPNPRYHGAPADALTVETHPTRVMVHGRGIWRPEGSKRSIALLGVGPWATLQVSMAQPRWQSGLVCTSGLPYDHAVRLALQLLFTVAPDRVEIASTGSEEAWAATALVAAEILGMEPEDVMPPLTVRRRLPQEVSLVETEEAPSGLWRARWRQVEILPVGPGAVVHEGRAGFVCQEAAETAARAFGLAHDPVTLMSARASKVFMRPAPGERAIRELT